MIAAIYARTQRLTASAACYTTGMEHSPTSATGSAWERTPWRAVQQAARQALAVAAGDAREKSP